MTDADLLLALRDCYDPVVKRNVVELGLVRSATLLEDHDAPGAGIAGAAPRYIAKITLLAPAAGEEAAAQLQAQIENRLAGLAAISRTSLELLPTPFPILR